MKKIIALYMPQFHVIDENNKWWGNNYTEWDNVKRGKKYKKNQYQPRIPLNNNYYCLLDSSVQEYQSELAMAYGIYGFCYYHYWFSGKLLLEKPMENMLKNKKIKIPFCISWANHTWRKSQSTDSKYILIEQKYGDSKEWIDHFNYLLPFFKDERYILKSNKPIFIIHDSSRFENLNEFMQCWNELAKANGFDGVFFINTLKNRRDIKLTKEYNFDAQFEFEPSFSIYNKSYLFEIISKIKRNFYRDFLHQVMVFDYNKIWNKIIKFNFNDYITYNGCYVDWDNTPRWKNSGNYHKNACPERFKYYFKKLYMKSNEFIFINAWNEWGEGAYLEPDEKNKYGYLQAIKDVVNNN